MKNYKCTDSTCYREIIYDFGCIEDLEMLANVGDAISVKFGEDGCVDIKEFRFSDYNRLDRDRKENYQCFIGENTEDDVWKEYTQPMLAQAENHGQAIAAIKTGEDILDKIDRLDDSQYVCVANWEAVICDIYQPCMDGWYAAIGCKKKE